MLTADTKKHIDSARQVLVGKVPDPKAQIDQITNALIYKFMDDMDVKAVDAGGKPSFFTGDLKQHAWSKLMDPRKGAQDRLNMYTEALEKFSTAASLPQLFRDIFRQAFLPYRDPETLNLFLKEIEFFDYNHSEELGNAFEYLLSIMGSQGDAGQFRTPRHIIDFMVDIIDPDYNDTILDPACGTAGFLISAYKHIVEKHDGLDTKGKKNSETLLTHQQKQKLMDNLEGYDISSDMVKLARVNMYLHGNKNPKIFEYDSLGNEERWGDMFDVMLANPPFMSPKGGVRPHKKFSLESSRSEVLFVDYIVSHLKQNGRAGIIVPEGIIFQSGKAHKQLRKALVEDGLMAVVSLPSGVFNPYAGVKTSILIFDNNRAKKSQHVVFAKVEHDGFDLGAQRRPSPQKNDLPTIAKVLINFRLGKFTNQEQIDDYLESEAALREVGEFSKVIDVKLVERSKIAESEDFNLSAARYLIAEARQNQKYPLADLGSICEFLRGITFSAKDKVINDEDYILVATTKAAQADGLRYEDLVRVTPSMVKKEKTYLQNGDLLISVANSSNLLGRKTFIKELPGGLRQYSFGAFMGCLRPIKEKVIPEYLNPFLESDRYKKFCLSRANTTTNISNLNWTDLSKFQIPLPPIEVQKQIVEELDSYQKIINGAHQVIENYKPTIKIDPAWPKKKIGDIATLMTGGTPSRSVREYWEKGTVPWLVSGDIHKGCIDDCSGRITIKGLENSNARILPSSSVMIALNGQGKTRGTVALLKADGFTCNQSLVAIKANESVLPEFLYFQLKGIYQDIRNINGDKQRGGLNMPIIRSLTVAIPDLKTQEQIVQMLEELDSGIKGTKKIAESYEQKIKDRIAEVWGE